MLDTKVHKPHLARMNFRELAQFIESEMRMSQVYQPVFLKLLLESSNGTVTEGEAADAFRHALNTDADKHFDVRRYPGDVLIEHGVVERFEGERYRLLGFEELTHNERRKLVELCDVRLERYLSGQRLPETQSGPGRV